MEASTLPRKKTTISKGKLKKSIKNVLYRPDEVFWPEVTYEEGKRLESVLKKHKIDIPEFKKAHWKDLKDIPKEQRPKPPKLQKVEGLLLGIRESTDAIQNGECFAIIIEAKVNPRLIVHPVLEMCTAKDIPVLCLTDLKKITATNFGVPTSCLGIRNYLLDVRNEITAIAENYQKPKQNNQNQKECNKIDKMDIEEIKAETTAKIDTFPFLYRTNKKCRVFVPTAQENISEPTRKFIGQDFIEFSDKPEKKNSKAYMKMILKRISNNPDRVKKK